MCIVHNQNIKPMAQPTQAGQKVKVYNDQDLVFTVQHFLGAAGKAMHKSIAEAIAEKPGTDPGVIFVAWDVNGRQGGAKAKDCEVIK